MTFVGVNIGALSVKVVALRDGRRVARTRAHEGRALEVLKEILADVDFAGAEFFGVSGHLGHISEVAAIQRALREVTGAFDAVVSLGGESFLVYLLTDGRITNVLSHNKCAAGSGEFFVQQIGRMGLSLEEAIRRSFAGKVVPLASRCSVHCKSDITHKLNRNEATPEDILHTLHDSMAGKVIALLEKGQRELKRVLLIGGVTRNAAMLAALREKQPGTEFVVLPESPWFEAWGSALLTRDEPLYRSPQLSVQPGLGQLPPLHLYTQPRASHRRARRGSRRPMGRWCWEWMRAPRPPRRCCSIRRRAAWWPRITRAPAAIPWRRRASASRPWQRQVGNRRGGSGRHHRFGAGIGRRLSGHRARLQRNLGAGGRGQPFRSPTWTRFLRLAARMPNTSTCATACRLTTR